MDEGQVQYLSAREFLDLSGDAAILLDVRPEYELSRLFDVQNILYCPYMEIDDNLDTLPKDKRLVIADAVGLRSKEVASELKDYGFANIYHLAGGIVDWERCGHPVTTDKSKILTGSCMCQLKTRKKK